MKQNGVVCLPGPPLLFFIFRFEYLIRGPKSYRDFRETGPSFAPKQAVPPFADKLLLLSRHIEKTSSPLVPLANRTCLSPPEIKRSSRLFSLLMTVHCGDLGQVKILDTARFPDGNGFLSHLGEDFEGWRLQPL